MVEKSRAGGGKSERGSPSFWRGDAVPRRSRMGETQDDLVRGGAVPWAGLPLQQQRHQIMRNN